MESPPKTGFGRLLIAFFCAPAYFFLRGKMVAGIAHTCLYLTALLTLIFGIGVFLWLAGVFHAVWDLAHVKQDYLIQRQASAIAEKLADARVSDRVGS